MHSQPSSRVKTFVVPRRTRVGPMLKRTGTPAATTEASASRKAVAQDWEHREFVQSVQLGVAQLSSFLNEFGARPAPASERARTRAAFFFWRTLRLRREVC